MTPHTGPIIAQRDSLTVVDCQACGFAHLRPIPDAAAQASYYRAAFWQTKGAGWRERYEAERDWLDMRHADWLSLLEAHTLGRTLLDVGCGYGHFLASAQARGWQACGLEPNVEAAEYARTYGAEIVGDTWEQFTRAGARFDAISALWLAEHLSDPRLFLDWCRARLYEAGALLLAVPNEWNFYQASAIELGKCAPDFFVHPTHTNYWNKGTLGNLLGRCGFKVVDWLATWPIDAYLSDGADYTRDEQLGFQLHANVRKQEAMMTSERRLERMRSWARMGVGRDLIVVALKG